MRNSSQSHASALRECRSIDAELEPRRGTQTEYDEDGRLTVLHLADRTTIDLGHDPDGTFRTLDVADARPIRVTAQHDVLGQPTRLTDTASGVTLGFAYDVSVPRVQAWTGPRSFSGNVGFQIGAAMTLDAETISLSSSIASRRPDVDRAMEYSVNGGLRRGGAETCNQYDDADRATCGGRRYDTRGALTRRGETRFTYDVLGRLRSSRTEATTTSYDWDPAGRLVGMTDRVHDEHFVYGAAMGPVAWRRDRDTAYFAYGSLPHVPDTMWVDRGSNGSIDERYRLVTDERGSVRVVVRLDGRDAGRVVQRIDYDAWGVPTVTSVSGFSRVQPFGFAGGIWLPEPGVWRFGARDYDPGVGAWTSGDPIGFAGGENLYGYCGGDPISRIDPSGLDAWSAAGSFAAGFAGAVLGGIAVLVGIGTPLAILAAGGIVAFGVISFAVTKYEIASGESPVNPGWW